MERRDLSAVMRICTQADGIRVLPWETEELFEQALVRNPDYSQVAINVPDGRTIGFAFAGHDGIRGGIHHLWVDRGHRRQGIAHAMVERILARFRAERPPVLRIRLIVLGSGSEALSFWTKLGFLQSSAPAEPSQVVAFYLDMEPASGEL
jgi:ribosomal protein S18 acetylase RimI-like enzyme